MIAACARGVVVVVCGAVRALAPPCPSAGVNKLSASKFLKMYKVAGYVLDKLPLEEGEAPPDLVMLCNEQPLPDGMSLATAHT